ncbi:hypothetical protein CEE39_06125 [bacterium (candidate division B38) B3_B38]|nr:MAG: hypothetical protein CEE39_06125 [bacterium (candidate division B38) B3_B38]
MSLLKDLNPAQREAVVNTEGPFLILAGAGSGKTRVITYRIAYLIDACGVKPEQIVAITFTNKAADEMKSRVQRLLGKRNVNPWISTFHSLCVHILRSRIGELGLTYNRNFAIYDEQDQLRLVKECLRELNLDEKLFSPRSILSRISRLKNSLASLEELPSPADDYRSQVVEQVFQLYQRRLLELNALDFDDLILRAVELFNRSASAREHYQELYRYCLVDEFQDTNRPQYLLIRHLAGKRKNLCVVGDEDQSIYRWRGADLGNILDFQKDFPRATLIKLEQNYRSTQNILKAAGAVVKHNIHRIGKTLWTENLAGEKVLFYQSLDSIEEASFVLAQIVSLGSLYKTHQIALLYRTNAQSRLFEEVLARQGIPYIIVGGMRFYERKEVKDILAYLSFLINPRDEISLKRIINVPPRGIGEKTIGKLEERAAQEKLSLWEVIAKRREGLSLTTKGETALERFVKLIKDLRQKAAALSASSLIKLVMDASGYLTYLKGEGDERAADRIENLMELINSAREYEEATGEGSVTSFLSRTSLTSDEDSYQEGRGVVLMTLHCAKGLEFPVVFLVGLEEGLFPHIRSMGSEEELEEERRLCYVGMTRAAQLLFLSYAIRRSAYGGRPRTSEPSRFLTEIPPELLNILERGKVFNPQKEPSVQPTEAYSSESIKEFFARHNIPFPTSSGEGAPNGKRPYRLGEEVYHPKFGKGVIIDIEGEGEETKLTVSFLRVGRKKLIARYAQLKKVNDSF